MLKRKPIDIESFRHLYPFESHYMDVNGFKYHYVDEGSGEPVVMVHGNPTWSFYYRALIQSLSDRFRTIVPAVYLTNPTAKPMTISSKPAWMTSKP